MKGGVAGREEGKGRNSTGNLVCCLTRIGKVASALSCAPSRRSRVRSGQHLVGAEVKLCLHDGERIDQCAGREREYSSAALGLVGQARFSFYSKISLDKIL